MCLHVDVRVVVSRVVEGRRNRCTRQRDADRRAIPLFFSLFALLLFALSLSSSSFVSSPACPLSRRGASSPFSLEPSTITAQSLGFYRRSDVATGSRDFRTLEWSRNRFVRAILSPMHMLSRYFFSKIFISRTFSRRRMIDDDFTVYRVCFLIDIRRFWIIISEYDSLLHKKNLVRTSAVCVLISFL